MADEAKICFEYAERLFQELMEEYYTNEDEFESGEARLANLNSTGEWEE
jgi:hypothetical protein